MYSDSYRWKRRRLRWNNGVVDDHARLALNLCRIVEFRQKITLAGSGKYYVPLYATRLTLLQFSGPPAEVKIA